MKETELKPCDNCNSTKDVQCTITDQGYYLELWQAYCLKDECQDLKIETEEYGTEEEAIKAWNTRKGEKEDEN